MRRQLWGGWAGLVLGWGRALGLGRMGQRQGVQGRSAVSSGRVDDAHSAGSGRRTRQPCVLRLIVRL